VRRFDVSEADFEARFSAFLDERRGSPADVDAAAAAIIEGVRTGGIAAVLSYAKRFDRAELTEETIRVTDAEIEAGVAGRGARRHRLRRQADRNLSSPSKAH
jgi:histidinol dehydrogenase